jgi:spermidine synthase
MLGTKILSVQKSKYNGNLRVVRTWGMGTYIQANGLTQSGGVVTGMWKQTIKKIYNLQFKINNCLILGLGGGTLVELVKNSWPEAKITGIDIDPEIIELGKKYLGLDNSDVHVIIGDVIKIPNLPNFPNKKFDLIIVDLYNGDQFPKKFEDEKFLKLMHKLISKKGILIFNRLYYKEKKIEAEKFGETLKKVFINVEVFRPQINMIFLCS